MTGPTPRLLRAIALATLAAAAVLGVGVMLLRPSPPSSPITTAVNVGDSADGYAATPAPAFVLASDATSEPATVTLPAGWNALAVYGNGDAAMPALPTAQPQGVSIQTADQALAFVLAGTSHRPRPTLIYVRLTDLGTLNTLCIGPVGSMPDEELVWAVAYAEDGMTTEDLDDHPSEWQPPQGFPRFAPFRPSPQLMPTPMPIAGAVIILSATEGQIKAELGLIKHYDDVVVCPSIETFWRLVPLVDARRTRPTTPPHPRPSTRCRTTSTSSPPRCTTSPAG